MKHLLFLFLTISVLNVYCTENPNLLFEFTVIPIEDAGVTSVAIPLDGVIFNTDDGRLALFEKSNTESEIPSQLEPGLNPKLWFMFDNSEGEKTYVVHLTNQPSNIQGGSRVKKHDQSVSLDINGRSILNYQYIEVPAPEGTNENFRRSAFIHPLFSPHGEVLTQIQPADHYHHYGIWNPWTSTTIDQAYDVDFWNLAKGEGRVQFGGFLGAEEGNVYVGIKVRHEHVSYVNQPEGNELLALNEVWDLRSWNMDNKSKVNMVDLTTTLNSPLSEGIMLNAYRYGGGIGYRATEKWGKNNSSVLTSEGKTRNSADATQARWCIVEGESSAGRSGILFLSHPSNRMHPEPMRMWDENSVDGKGEIFFQFTPIRHNEWYIEPGRSYTQKYRMIVFDGEMTPEEAEKYWNAFARSPMIVFD